MANTLRKLADDLDKNYDTASDKGHDALMADLAELLADAFRYEFHDFKNKRYAAPKMELRIKLLKLAQNVVDGRYDN